MLEIHPLQLLMVFILEGGGVVFGWVGSVPRYVPRLGYVQ